MFVEEPDDDSAVWTRTNHGVTRQAIGPLHPPHDGRLVVRSRQGGSKHTPLFGKRDTSADLSQPAAPVTKVCFW